MLVALLGGCGTHSVSVVQKDSDFPAPLVVPMSAQVGLYFPPEFLNYSFHETRPRGGEWTIALGASQAQVFRSVLGAMFTGYRELPSEQPVPGLDALIVPHVQEFQFALPTDTRSNVFEIWVKYDLSIRDTKGDEVGHWVFTAYGKTPSAFMKSSEEAIKAATVVALRDAGASMISGLSRDERIRGWIGVRPENRPETAF